MNIVITGAAGFIGMHTSLFFLKNTNDKIYGIDNLNNYYDVALKKKRISILKKFKNFNFLKFDLQNKKKLHNFFKKKKINFIIHLAAQAGVRYSLIRPDKYIDCNITVFLNLLEICQKFKIKNMFYSSSSSVYGSNKKYPFSEIDETKKPKNIYAASKLFNENLAYAYSELYKINLTGLRFFTVYGPWGRPDMALYIFADRIMKNKSINVFNSGNMTRDFTFVDDIVKSIYKLYKKRYKSKFINPEIYNIGFGKPCNLISFIKEIERNLNKKAKMKFLGMQMGDVKKTFSNTKKLTKLIKYKPKTNYIKGVKIFCDWFLKYHYEKK